MSAGPATLFRIILPVSDMQRAVIFYERVLAARGTRVSEGRCYFDCGGVILAVFDPAADGDAYSPTPLSEWLYFAVDDLEATHRTCVAAGGVLSTDGVHGSPAGQIHTRPWGERSFYALDPFGNKICFVDRTTVYRGGASRA